MIPVFIRKSITLIVLTSYIAQMMLPVAHAMEADRYDYHIAMTASEAEGYALQLSRREKNAEGAFQLLSRLKLKDGQHLQKSYEEDELGQLFSQATSQNLTYEGSGAGIKWKIPGVGNLRMSTDGSVIWDQQDTPSALISYNIIVHTVGELHIQSLFVKELTLNTPKTTINGVLHADHLQSNYLIVNEGAVQLQFLEGAGAFINHSLVKAEENAITRIRTFKNVKSKEGTSTPRLEGKKLRVAPSTHLFQNTEGCEVVIDDLNIRPAVDSKFINKGTINTINTTVGRDNVLNKGRWASESIILTGKDFQNETDGEFIARKKFWLNASLTNNGKLTTKGEAVFANLPACYGRLMNKGTWHHEGDLRFASYGNVHITNRHKIQWTKGTSSTCSEKRVCWSNHGTWILESIIGDSKEAEIHNSGFFQLIDSQISIESFDNNKSGKMVLTPNSTVDLYQVAFNDGIFEGGIIQSHHPRIFLCNDGSMTVQGISGDGDFNNGGYFALEGICDVKSFTNKKEGKVVLSPTSEIVFSACSHNYGSFEGGLIRSNIALYGPSFYNRGSMIVQGILGKGRFANFGKLKLDGTAEQPALIDIEELDNGRRKVKHIETQEAYEPELSGQYIVVGANNKKIENTERGKMVTQGLLSTKKGKIINWGIWHHCGDLSLGQTEILNDETGNIFWEQGEWEALGRDVENYKPHVNYFRAHEKHNPSWVNIDKSKVNVHKRKDKKSTPEDLISYTNKGKWVFKDINGYGGVDLRNEDEGVFNFTDKTYLWMDQFHNAPKGQMVFSPSTELTFHETLNMGLFQADEIYMWSSIFLNCGTTTVNSLTGYGYFRNMAQVNMIGTQRKPVSLCCHDFRNGYSSSDENLEIMKKAYKQANLPMPTAHLNGMHVKATGWLDNYKNGQMDTKGNFTSKGKQAFIRNHGTWNHKGNAEFIESNIRNTGMMDFDGNFEADRVDFQNQQKGTWRSHNGKIDLNEVDLENYGKMYWRYADFTYNPKKSAEPFLNKGTWIMGSVKSNKWLDVNNRGTLQLDHGILYFSSLKNYKDLIFNGGCYGVKNLYNLNGRLLFNDRQWKISKEDLPESSGRYWSYYDRNGHLQILNHFRDEGIIESAYPLTFDYAKIPHNPRLKTGVILKELPKNGLDSLLSLGCYQFSTSYKLANQHLSDNVIYVDKDYRTTAIKYKLKDTLNHPKAKDGILEGSILTWDFDIYNEWLWDEHIEKHASKILKDLSDKGYIRQPLSITTSVDGDFSTPKPYIFNNLNLLNLTINGNLTLPSNFHVGSVLFTIHGGLTLGKDNNNLASLAATDGPLTVIAWWIDGRFGQFYGAKNTKLQATKKDINIGAPKTCPANRNEKLGCAHHWTTENGNVWASKEIYNTNGAYVSSGGTLDLEAANKLDLNYSQVWSKGTASFLANNEIETRRAIIKGNWEGKWKAKKIFIGRAPQENLHIGYVSSGYRNESGWAVMSDQSEVHYGWTLTFDTSELIISSSTVSSYIGICIKRNGWGFDFLSTEEDHQNPSSLKLESNWVTWGGPHENNKRYFPPKILANQKIDASMDNLSIAGMLNAATFNFEAAKSGTFKNDCPYRQVIVPTTIIVDITAFAQEFAKQGGFMKLTPKGDVKPDFMGSEKPFVFASNQAAYLVNPEKPAEFRPPLRYLNPMKFLSPSMWDMFLQPITCHFLGKAGFRQSFGNSPFYTVLQLTENWTQKMGRNHIFHEELESLTHVIFVQKCLEKDQINLLHTFLAAPKEEVNKFQSNGDISGDNFNAKAGEKLEFINNQIDMTDSIATESGGDTIRKTTTYRTITSQNNTTTIKDNAYPQQLMRAGKKIKITGKGDYDCTGTYTSAEHIQENLEGEIRERPTTTTTTTITESSKNSLFSNSSSREVNSQTTHLPTTKEADTIESKSEKGIRGEGVSHKAKKKIIYDAPFVEIDAAQSQNSHHKESECGNGISSVQSISRQESSHITPSTLIAEEIIFKSPSVTLTGTDILALILDVSAAKVKFYVGPAKGRASNYQQTKGESPLAHFDVGCSSWTDVLRPSQILVEKLKLATIPTAENVLDTVQLPKESIEIIGHYIEKITNPESHYENWSHSYQAIPDEAKIVVAMTIAAITSGAAASLGATLCGAGTLGASVVATGFQAICIQAGVNFAGHGDPLKTFEYLGSEDGLRSIGASMAKTTLVGNGGYNSSYGLFDNVLANMWRNAVGVGVDATIGGNKVNGEAFWKAILQSVVESGASHAAHGIGGFPESSSEEYALKNAFQGISAAFAKGLSNLVNGDKFEKNMAAAGFGAVLSKMIAQTLTNEQVIRREIRTEAIQKGIFLTVDQENHLYMDRVKQIVEISKIVTASLGLVTGLDVASLVAAASPVLEEDFAANQQRHISEQMKQQKEMHEKKAEKETKKPKKPRKTLRPTRKTKQASVKITVESEDLYLNMLDQQQKSPQEEYISLAAQNVEKHNNTTQPAKLQKSVMITFADPQTGESTEMTWEQGVKELNQSLDLASFIPNPFGMACLAVGLSRDLYTNKTTVGDILFDTALGIGAVKAIQWTCRGIKVLYKCGKTALVHLGEKISSQFQNPFAYQEALLQKIFGPSYSVMSRQPSIQNRVPFITGTRTSAFFPEDVQYGNLLILGEREGAYLGHKRDSTGLNSAIQCLRKCVSNWTKSPNGALAVGVHGTEEGVLLNRMSVHAPQQNKHTKEILSNIPLIYRLEYALADHRLLAKIIKRNPGFNKNNLVAMLSCDVGKAEFAQNLANALGARVLAPTEILWHYEDGSFIIAAIKNILHDPKADFTKLGQFKVFYPKNVQAPLPPVKKPTTGAYLGRNGQPLDALSKKLKAMRNNPKGDWHIADLQFIAQRYGIGYRQHSTSHVTFSYPNLKEALVPARKPLHPVYVKRFLDFLESVLAEQAKK